MILWYYDTMILWYYDIMILWYYDIMILWYYDVMILWYYGIMIIWYHDFMILWYYDTVILWHSRQYLLRCHRLNICQHPPMADVETGDLADVGHATSANSLNIRLKKQSVLAYKIAVKFYNLDSWHLHPFVVWVQRPE